ncbi:MAG: MFS transporter [Acidimicrobiia bacterium]|nr:MFS transporter [Acidimicrobiia bacterium]
MPEKLLSRPFVLASLATFTHGMAFALFIHFPGFLEELGATEVIIGLIVGFAAIASIVVRPLVGRLMDRRGRRPLILFGNSLNVVALALYLTVAQIDGWVYAIRILHGLSEAILFTVLFTFAADWVPERRRTQGLALFGVAGMLPIALAGVLGDVILNRWDFDVFFIVAVGFALASLLLSLPLHDAPHLSEQPPARGFLASITGIHLLPLWWITFVFSFVLTAYFTFLKTFVNETGVGSVGLFFAFYAGTAVALRLTFGWVPDRVGPKRALGPAMLFLAAGLVVLSGATTDSAVAVAGILCGVGHGYTFPILYALTVTRARIAERGAAMAVYTGLFDVGTLIGGPVLGLAIRWFSYQTMFLSTAVFVVAGLGLFALWDRETMRRPSVASPGGGGAP